jgi:hypothetical protein
MSDNGQDARSAAPVRLCCGQRHSGALCPDGKVMCCLCFERVTLAELSETVDGQLTDVCKTCYENEASRV